MTAQIIRLADRRAAAQGRPDPSSKRTPGQPTILELIQQVADNLGIDIEAPFRTKPKGGR